MCLILMEINLLTKDSNVTHVESQGCFGSEIRDFVSIATSCLFAISQLSSYTFPALKQLCMSECTCDYAQKKEFPTRNTVSQQQQQLKGGFFHALQVYLFISSKLILKSIFENQTNV